jgi:hypothetical protein
VVDAQALSRILDEAMTIAAKKFRAKDQDGHGTPRASRDANLLKLLIARSL